MLDRVRLFLDKGDLESARAALGDDLREFCAEEFVRGGLRHPLVGPKSAKLREELQSLAARLTEDAQRARAVVMALERVDASVRKKAVDHGTLDRINFALQVLLPGAALVLEEALENARFKLGAASSNVEDPLSGVMKSVSPEASLLVTAAEEGMKLFEGNRLERLQDGSLENIDSPEPDEPMISMLINDELWLECPACGDELRTPLASFGKELRCVCSRPMTVPRPSLARMTEYLKAKRDALRGMSRCRICNSVIQTAGDAFMKAGFCTALCASQGRDQFGEHVPREGARDGEDVRFRCHCGATMTAPLTEVGEKVACLSCPLVVWIPAPSLESPARRSGPRTCAKCGKPVKPTARKCMYCGTPPAP